MFEFSSTKKQNSSGPAVKNNSTKGSLSFINEKSNKQTLSKLVQTKGVSGKKDSSSLSEIINSGHIQPKLVLGKPNDPYEQEADQMAEKVVNSPKTDSRNEIKRQEEEKEEPAQTKVQLQKEEKKEPAQGKVQFQEEEKEEPAQTKVQLQEEEKKEPVQAKVQLKEEEKEEPAQTKVQLAADEKKEPPQAKVQLQEEEKEEPAQTKVQLQEEKEKPAQAKIQLQEEEKKEPAQGKVQLKEEEKEEPAQAKVQLQEEKEPAQGKIQFQEEEKKEPAQAKVQLQEEEKKEPVQAKSSGKVNDADISKQLKSTKGSGLPLPTETKSSMESGFGTDFGGVRIHTDSNAVQMNKSLNAQAFTQGKDIYFNTGKYNPGTSEGNKLIAHELTHTVQQGAAPKLKRIGNTEKTIQRQEESDGENTAEEQVDFEAELAASEAEAKAAIDPAPAEQAKKEALTEEPILEEKPKEEVKEEIPKEEIPKEGEEKKKPEKETGPKGKKKKGEENKGEVGQYLEQQSAGVCEEAATKSGELAANEKTHDDAESKLTQTEEAVVPPAEEAQSQGNAEQVESLDQAPPPEPNEEAAKAEMNSAVEEAVPSDIEELNEFKSQGKAKVVGNKVLGKVKEDADAVQTTYNEIETAPAPKPSENIPTELPPEEIAPETPELNLGQDAVPPIKDEHADLSEFDKQSDELLEKEGITEEQLDMVDEGELFEAGKERKNVKKKAVEEPAKLKEMSEKETKKVETDLQAEEKSSREEMGNKRKDGLKNTKDKQQKTKTDIEKKREAVTKKINGIYERAKTSVTKKLENLEKDSLTKFDKGQADASNDFEYEVKRDIDAWKRERYSGLFGGVKWLKDKLFGIADFPEVQSAFDRARNSYIKKLDLLIKNITLENQQVIQSCKEELANAKKEIKEYVDSLGPELKSTGQQAMEEMKSKLEEMDKFIDQKKDELAKKLCAKKEEAIKKIDEKIEKMKEEMSGLISKLVNFLLDAMLKFFKWALKKLGLDGGRLMQILEKGAAVIRKIVGDPIGFIMNLVKAVKNGINNFVANIKQHLISGLIGWLTGAMGDIDIKLPDKWDLKGILHLILQILGLTWTNIRKKLVAKVGENVVSGIETGVDIVKRVIAEGPMALWDMIKEKAEEIKEQVMEGIRNWVIVQVVKQAVIKLLSFLNPAGAILQAILAIYNTIMFFVENWERIVEFVASVFNSIADIAMGKLGAAAAYIEKTLAMTIPIILAFLARLIGLGGIGKAVKNIIMKVRKPIDKVIDKVIDFIVKKAKALIQKGKVAVKKGVEKGKEGLKGLVEWWKTKKSFKGQDNKSHKLFYKGKEDAAKLYVASKEEEMKPFFANRKKEISKITDEKKKDSAEQSYRKANEIVTEIDGLSDKIQAAQRNRGKTKPIDATTKKYFGQLKIKLDALSATIAKLMFEEEPEFPPAVLPPFNNGVRARGFTAEYISKKTPQGSENTTIDVPGFNIITLHGLGKGSNPWVRMHLLTHLLGGMGTSSNLVPAEGKGTNEKFRDKIEHPARDFKDGKLSPKTAKESDGNLTWYRVQVKFGGHGDKKFQHFPNYIGAEFGTYSWNGKKWNKIPAPSGMPNNASWSQSVTPPVISGIAPPRKFYLDTDGSNSLRQIPGIGSFGYTIWIERRDNGVFGTKANFKKRMLDRAAESGKTNTWKPLIEIVISDPNVEMKP